MATLHHFTKFLKMKIIQCEECNIFFELQKVDLDRIQKALLMNWSTILITCPNCNKRTTWHKSLKVFDDPDLLKPKKEVEKIEMDEDILPKNYQIFVSKNKNLKFKLIKNREKFFLYNLEELFAKTSIDKRFF